LNEPTTFGPGEATVRDPLNIGATALPVVTVDFKDSANTPLPRDD
jgi:hypothetical protein